MNRSLKLSMLLALALGSSQAVALELGQIQVKSALGQPLIAEIPVTPESPADLRNLSARLASDEDFLRAGITEGRARVPLSFSIVNGPGGSKLIRITSTDAINDPYLDLLVQVDNAAGKSVREYTILLDPPGMAARPPVPQAAARPRRASPAQRPAPPAPRAAAPAAPAVGSSVTVQRGQTLSAIAQQVMPAGANLNQTLLALKQANPDAFYRDNINALKSGAVLRVPTADEARAMTVVAALEEVRRQNGDWRAGAAGTPISVADSATRAIASSSPTVPASKRVDHLELLPSSGGARHAAAGGGKTAADLRRDLQRSQESLAALQQQGADLRSRLKDLEDINRKNERLLSLKDSEIAELQRKLAAAGKATPAGATTAAPAAAGKPLTPTPTPAAAASTAGKTAPATAASAPVVAGATPATASSAKATAPVAASAAAPAKPVAAKPVAKPAAAKPVPSPAGEPWYMQTWAWGAGAVAALLLLLLVFRGRRNKGTGRASGSSLADRFGAVPALGADDADPDQDELLDQLAEHPDDINLHLELVSLYYHRRDVERFEAAAEAMYAHIADPQQSEWQDVAAMGEDLVPGHPLFAGVDTSVPEAERAPLGGLDPDDYDADATVAVPPPMPAGPAKISEYHFDFNLTPRQEAARKAEAEAQLRDEPEHAFEHDATAGHDPAEPAPTADATTDIPSWAPDAGGVDYEPTEFSDDPIDTKLDLARAYLDMGDADGARAMLEEVLAEGSQPQRDTARRLLDGIV
ncbi:FimV/HubP family polar landmark protein [Dyella sp. KRB-257]|uniref:FimV/HubP family polar landmark protein n=1 Tax=Dyella sp. KRB-257 TaxID=3400915 RepID=UPI003C0328A5